MYMNVGLVANSLQKNWSTWPTQSRSTALNRLHLAGWGIFDLAELVGCPMTEIERVMAYEFLPPAEKFRIAAIEHMGKVSRRRPRT
jgi:hypothetical protein